jgi:cyclopropane-fatty-acyl-phospholipid synthase
VRAWLSNPQRPSRAFRIGEAHYDLGNDLFRAMLDSRMVYSCGYWEGANDLETAQRQKLELICRKLALAPGQRLLDIGCGWGSLAQYAAAQYGVPVVGVTVSKEQAAMAKQRCAGLPVDIRLQDYRDVDGSFDCVASIGMIEHVGAKNYGAYFDKVRRLVAPGGLLLLHTIGNVATTQVTDPWIERYIFPAGKLPSLQQLADAAVGRFVIEDVHNFGADYDRTLTSWYRNFRAGWPALRKSYDDTFFRMWKYYLLTCAGAFRARSIQLWQLVLAADGVPGGYRRPSSTG